MSLCMRSGAHVGHTHAKEDHRAYLFDELFQCGADGHDEGMREGSVCVKTAAQMEQIKQHDNTNTARSTHSSSNTQQLNSNE